MNLWDVIITVGAEILKAIVADGLSDHVRKRLARRRTLRHTQRWRGLYAQLQGNQQQRLIHRLYTEADENAPST
jgi:hypothetical protein